MQGKLIRYLPKCPIIAVTPNENTYKYCKTCRGIYPYYNENVNESEEKIIQKLTLFRIIHFSLEKNLCRANSYAVVTFGDLKNIPGKTNTIRFIKIEKNEN